MFFKKKSEEKKLTGVSFETFDNIENGKPVKKLLVKANLAGPEDLEGFIAIIQLLLNENDKLAYCLSEGIKNSSSKSGWSESGNKIIDVIVKNQKDKKQHLPESERKRTRFPLVRPTSVLPNLNVRMNNE